MGFTRDETARGVAEVRKRKKKKTKKREGRKVAIFTRKCEAFLHALFSSSFLFSRFQDPACFSVVVPLFTSK